jgi:hypothetical protein
VWPVIVGAVVGGVFTLIGGLAGQVRHDRRERLGLAELLRYEIVLNVFAMENYIETYAEDPHDEEAHAEAARVMVLHSSTATWRQHSPQLISLFDYDFRESLVAAYAALISNEAEPGRHRHATVDTLRVFDYAQKQLEPHTRPRWFDRHIWRL